MISSHNILSSRKTDTWLDENNRYVDLEESVKWASTMGRWEFFKYNGEGVMVTKNSEKTVQITLFQMVIWYKPPPLFFKSLSLNITQRYCS